jgi:hypothetical protein
VATAAVAVAAGAVTETSRSIEVAPGRNQAGNALRRGDDITLRNVRVGGRRYDTVMTDAR